MILRVYAMWGRSKIILGFYLFIYVPDTIAAFVFASVFDNPNTYMSSMFETLLVTWKLSLTRFSRYNRDVSRSFDVLYNIQLSIVYLDVYDPHVYHFHGIVNSSSHPNI